MTSSLSRAAKATQGCHITAAEASGVPKETSPHPEPLADRDANLPADAGVDIAANAARIASSDVHNALSIMSTLAQPATCDAQLHRSYNTGIKRA